jgi:transcriptional regulator with XRE-family HTH domain
MYRTKLHQAEGKIGQRLRQLRLERSLTHEELDALAGTKQAVIQKIENGHSKRPRILADLAIALGVNPAWLQWGEPYALKYLDQES